MLNTTRGLVMGFGVLARLGSVNHFTGTPQYCVNKILGEGTASHIIHGPLCRKQGTVHRPLAVSEFTARCCFFLRKCSLNVHTLIHRLDRCFLCNILQTLLLVFVHYAVPGVL